MPTISGLTRSQGDAVYAPNLPKIAWTMDPTNAYNSVASGASGSGWAHRIVWPQTGVIDRLAVWCNATGSGNVDIGVFDTTLTTRNLLGHTGSVALVATSWVSAAPLATLNVTAGVSADLAFVVDNATASVASGAMKGNSMGTFPTGWIPVPSGTPAKFNAFITAAFPLASTLAETAFSADLNVPLIMARYA